MSAVLIDFPAPAYRDPVMALRRLAEEIERGEYGEVTSCAVVTFGNRLEVFGSGSDSAGPTIALLLRAATHRFDAEIEGYGRD